MNKYERIFGAGPRGLLISLGLLAVVWQLEAAVALPSITDSHTFRWAVFVLTTVGSIILVCWGIKSLPPAARGKEIVTTGAFRYFRHPLYASFLSCSNFGLAVLLNNWIYIVWAVLLHGIWHWNVRSEENLMRREFPNEYEKYCKITGRFVPRLWNLQH
ncbi:MAG: isoprenylcysteine carboxylmethyltransferase family protein [Acidobacteriota bacterium]|nr:MAG: isoprenylcysteine carboxylmethyltransferase family protein [Acidobacteriota bacterium]